MAPLIPRNPGAIAPITQITPKIAKELGHEQISQITWNGLMEQVEAAVELNWPWSVATYKTMTTDSQIRSLLRGITLPIMQFQYSIDPAGARDEVVQHVSDDLGIPIKGQDPKPVPRGRDRFSWHKYLRHALLSIVYGHMIFEQLYSIDDQNKAHIQKWSPRMPGTISRWDFDDRAHLRGVYQFNTAGMFSPFGSQLSPYGDIFLPVNRLMIHTHDQEGAQWTGNSLLRAAYKNWLIKDKLLRVDALKHERNGMGVPTFEAPPGASPAVIKRLDEMAQSYKAGEASGGAVPNGARLRLVGVEGALPDTLASVHYHDQQMAKLFLEMLTELGQTKTGSRALGNTFVQFFSMSLRAILDELLEVTNYHGVEDLVDLNWGPDEPAPKITYDDIADPSVPMAELVSLISAGAIIVDDKTEQWVRARYNMPDMDMSDPARIAAKTAASTNPIMENLPGGVAGDRKSSLPSQQGHGVPPGGQPATLRKRLADKMRHGKVDVVAGNKGIVYKRSDGKWDFRVEAANGNELSNSSQGYENRSDAVTVLTNSARVNTIEFEDDDGEEG